MAGAWAAGAARAAGAALRFLTACAPALNGNVAASAAVKPAAKYTAKLRIFVLHLDRKGPRPTPAVNARQRTNPRMIVQL
jgi:hypothetical protein